MSRNIKILLSRTRGVILLIFFTLTLPPYYTLVFISGRKGKSCEQNQRKKCRRNKEHEVKRFLIQKLVQHKMLTMFGGQLLNFELLITGHKYRIFQQSIHCCYCKGQNATIRAMTVLLFFSLSIFSGCEFQLFSHLLR